MAILSKVTGFWESLSFVKNTKKMRKTLMDYLQGEGVKCEVKDGGVFFCYADKEYVLSFIVEENYTKCVICGDATNDGYESLPRLDRCIIADKANIHCGYTTKACVFDEHIEVSETFYFTSRRMMLQLFIKHFEQLENCLYAVEHLLCERVEKQKSSVTPRRQIGFIVPREESESELLKISAQNNCRL